MRLIIMIAVMFMVDNVPLYLQAVCDRFYPKIQDLLNVVQYVGLTLETLRELHKFMHSLNLSD